MRHHYQEIIPQVSQIKIARPVIVSLQDPSPRKNFKFGISHGNLRS